MTSNILLFVKTKKILQNLHYRFLIFITLQAFGQSFLQPDITIFKQNLEALENLNSKLKLYQKVGSICPYNKGCWGLLECMVLKDLILLG